MTTQLQDPPQTMRAAAPQSPAAPADTPLLVYIHIPKNAGSTVFRILLRNFGDGLETFYTDRQGRFLTEREFTHLVHDLRARGRTGLSAHDVRPLPNAAADALGVNYFTFVRDPIKRAISMYHYERANPDVPADDPALRSFAEYVQLRPDYDNAISNWQTYNLVESGRFADARPLLDRFLLVGIVEAFDESLLVLQNRYRPRRLRVGYRQVNISPNKSVRSDALDAATYERLRELNAEDYQLYDYARKRLADDLADVPLASWRLKLLRWHNRWFGRK